jgi:hypothetical protein
MCKWSHDMHVKCICELCTHPGNYESEQFLKTEYINTDVVLHISATFVPVCVYEV